MPKDKPPSPSKHSLHSSNDIVLESDNKKLKKPSNLEFNPEFKQAFELMESSDQHLFITGKAGTGKSTLLQHFRQTTTKNVIVLAPTGVAAINVKGQTIHSFFGFPPHPVGPDQIRKRRNRKMYENLDTIIIDEISMVRADLLDSINYFMRINGKKRHLPFGGVQMIFIGDMFQLPPVLSSDEEKRMFNFLYDTPYFFSAHALHGIPLQHIELQKVYRQKDADFLGLLDRIRIKDLDLPAFQQINKRHDRYFVPKEEDHFITLCSTNYIAKKINDTKLTSLQTPLYRYKGLIDGDFKRKFLPTEEALTLKEGAQVMFVKNDMEGRWVNGTLGTVEFADEDTISVKIITEEEERTFLVPKVTWEIRKYLYNEEEKKITTEIIGSFTQFPLRLAWAITIHKSQGKTFDKVIINLGNGAFAPGQVYVALSRCTTLGGIVLQQPLRHHDIIVDERIIAFAKQHDL